MVFVKYHCKPGDEQAILSVRITTSHPGLSLSALRDPSPTAVLTLQFHIRCISSDRPAQPLTMCTSGTLFDAIKPEDGPMDNLARGMLGSGLVSTNASDGSRKAISLGNFRVHRVRQDNDDAENLRQRPGTNFITVPAQESGETVKVSHAISSEHLFAYAERTTPSLLRIGERYDIRALEGYVAATWWCWGSLNGDLKNKKLSSFQRPYHPCHDEGAIPEDRERPGWVTGEHIARLKFEMEAGGECCSVEVIE